MKEYIKELKESQLTNALKRSALHTTVTWLYSIVLHFLSCFMSLPIYHPICHRWKSLVHPDAQIFQILTSPSTGSALASRYRHQDLRDGISSSGVGNTLAIHCHTFSFSLLSFSFFSTLFSVGRRRNNYGRPLMVTMYISS